MKSIKWKMVLAILVIVVVSSLLTVVAGLMNSFKVTEDIIKNEYEDKLNSAGNMLEIYLNEQFGTISLSAKGDLIDSNGESIAGRNEHIDEL